MKVFLCDPQHFIVDAYKDFRYAFKGLRYGWYFDGEEEPIGPFKSKWEAEKALSLYIFEWKGIGEQAALYLDTWRTVSLMRLQKGDWK